MLGPDGVGKSTLARLAAEHFCHRHPTTLTRWVTGTPTERVVPFGAFSHLVDIAEHRQARRAVAGGPGVAERAAQQGDLLLVVDEAHDLDILSATLVYQLALAGAARMIVTARADAAPRGRSRRCGPTVCWIGSTSSRRGGATTPAEVDEFLAELPARRRASVLDYLAVAEPLSLADLTALAGDGAVSQAEDLGAAETRVRDGDADDRWSTPRTRCSPNARVPRWATTAHGSGAPSWSTLLSQHPSDHPSDRLRLASLALDSDAPQPVAEVADAAQQALRLGDLLLAERFARAALERSGGLDGTAGAGPGPGVAGPRPRSRRGAGGGRSRRRCPSPS